MTVKKHPHSIGGFASQEHSIASLNMPRRVVDIYTGAVFNGSTGLEVPTATFRLNQSGWPELISYDPGLHDDINDSWINSNDNLWLFRAEVPEP